jgi:hypothetical protein
MTADTFTGIIDQLERQKTAIDRALAALRDVGSPATAAKGEPTTTAEVPARKRGKRSAAVRRRMALAQKLRWAKIKGESAPPAPPSPEPSKPRRQISAEGLKRIIAATKKRWRLQKAAAKAASVKKVAAKKVVKAPSAKAAKKIAPVRKAAVKAASAPVATPALAQAAG